MTQSTRRRGEIERTLAAAARRLDALANRLTGAAAAVSGASKLLAEAVAVADQGDGGEAALRALTTATEGAARELLAHSAGGAVAAAIQVDEITARLVGLVQRRARDQVRAAPGAAAGAEDA